jgi:NTE family protein
MDQVRSLRARMLVGHFDRNPGAGVYLRIGNSVRYVCQQAGLEPSQASELIAASLADAEVEQAGAFATTLRRLSPADFDRLFRHGWEMADCTLVSRGRGRFRRHRWRPTRTAAMAAPRRSLPFGARR